MIKKPLNPVWSKAETDEIGQDITFSVRSTEPNMCPKMKVLDSRDADDSNMEGHLGFHKVWPLLLKTQNR